MSDNIRIITRGDDCGSSHSANLGIMEAAKAGLLKNISVMAPCSFIEEGASMFANRTEFCFGLHATLNAEWDAVKWGPVLPPEQVPSLIDQHGHFLPAPRDFQEHPPRLQEILAELQAQLDKARRLGFLISYVDSHMMIEWDRGRAGRADARLDGAGRAALSRRLRPPTAKGRAERRSERGLHQQTGGGPEGQYLFVTHPTIDASEVRMLGNKHETAEQIAATRSLDIRLLTDPRVLACYERFHIVPLRYDQAERVRDRLPTAEELGW